MAKVLLIALDAAEAVAGTGFAQALGLPFDLLVLTGSADTDLGAERVLTGGLSEWPTADAFAKGVKEVAQGYSHFAAVSSMASKDGMARLAGLLDAAMVTDVVALSSPTVYQRPVVAGSILATVEILAEPVVITFRPAGFAHVSRAGSSSVESVNFPEDNRVQRSSSAGRSGGRPDLSQAKVIVSGGRPLKDAETFERIVGGLADKLGGAVGATRAAVDSGIAPNQLQVGQTGKIVAPDLYIAAGISGSTQHMAGIKDSKVIVAINKDADAPIFEVADYGLVADLYEAIPELTSKVG